MEERTGETNPNSAEKPARGPSKLQTIITLLACGGALAWATKTSLDGMKPSTQWIKQLRKGDAEDRQVAARQLGDLGSEEASTVLPMLVTAMSDPDELVRAAASSALGTAGLAAIQAKVKNVDLKAVGLALIGALKDEGADVRAAAAYSLGEFAQKLKGPDFPADPASVAQGLARLATDPEALARKRGEVALAKLGANAPVPAPAELVEGLNAWPAKEARATAAVVLGWFKTDVGSTVPPLIRALADKEPEVRSNAAAALGRLGEDAALALPTLASTLADPFAPVPIPSLGSALAGAQGGGSYGSDVPTDPAVQAALAIGRIATAGDPAKVSVSAEAVEALVKASQSDRQALREAASSALKRIGKGASAAIPAMIQRLVASAPTANYGSGPVVATLLGDIAPGSDRAVEAITALTSALDAEFDFTRMAAVEALGKFGPAAIAALPRLKELGQGAAGDLAAAVKLASDRIEGKVPVEVPRRQGGRGRGRG